MCFYERYPLELALVYPLLVSLRIGNTVSVVYQRAIF
jgi:hypothetical protein